MQSKEGLLEYPLEVEVEPDYCMERAQCIHFKEQVTTRGTSDKLLLPNFSFVSYLYVSVDLDVLHAGISKLFTSIIILVNIRTLLFRI